MPLSPHKPKVEKSRSIISQVMDELIDEAFPAFPAFPAEEPTKTTLSVSTTSVASALNAALTTSPAETAEPAEPANPLMTKNEKGETVYGRHPTLCGNERWMKNAGFYKSCVHRGKEVCPTCGLIEYCSEKCRFEHLNTHAPFCNPAYASERWAPDLSFLEKTSKDKNEASIAGTSLWGIVPAFDILSLEDPAMYFQDVNILLPISGDLRNAIVTVNALPCAYKKVCDITLNDPNTTIVIRNALMLMIIFVYPNKFEATKTVLQLWYSAALKLKDWKKLKYELLPFIERAYAKNMKGKATSQVSQRWTKGTASLRLTLTRRQWKQMMEILNNGDAIDLNEAMAARRAAIDKDKIVTNKTLYDMPAVHRRSHMRFLTTGMLLPFGQPVGCFDMPNPTLFSSDGEYLNTSGNTPLDSWFLDDVLASGRKFSVLENDIYHALYQHVGSTLFEFCLHLSESKLKVNFHLYCVETKKLDGTLGNNKSHHVNGLNFLQMGSYDGNDLRLE